MNNPFINFIDNSIGVTTWSWNFGDPATTTSNVSNIPTQSHIFSDTGIFRVTLIVESGKNCSDTAYKDIPIYLDRLIYVPNAFTPNEDNINDVFKPIVSGIERENYKFIIFDRWGKEIFSTTDYDAGWDGTINGKKTSMGVYSYIIEYKEIQGIYGKLKGVVTLVR